VLAVALHRQLLELSRQAREASLVGQHRGRWCIEEIVVPHGDESHEHRQVAIE
jgi:hypothetical protein